MNEILIPRVRIVFPFLQNQRTNKDSGELDGYSVMALFDKTEEGKNQELIIRRAIKETLEKEKGTEKKNWPKPYSLSDFNFKESYPESTYFPLRDGDKNVAEGDEDNVKCGKIYITFKSKKKQPVCAVKRENGFAIIPEDKIADVIYSGCYCDLIVRPFFYSTKNDKGATVEGVGFNLAAVTRVDKGERIGGGAPVNLADFYEGGNQGMYLGDDDFDSGDDGDDL